VTYDQPNPVTFLRVPRCSRCGSHRTRLAGELGHQHERPEVCERGDDLQGLRYLRSPATRKRRGLHVYGSVYVALRHSLYAYPE
jgi:hypothetical protein